MAWYRERHLEYLLASAAFCWGAWLVSPFWEAFPSAPGFRVMNAIAPEWAWGGVMMASGWLLWWSLRRLAYPLRRVALLSMSLLWLAIWVAFLLANWRGTATIVYIHLAYLCIIAYLRLSNVKQ